MRYLENEKQQLSAWKGSRKFIPCKGLRRQIEVKVQNELADNPLHTQTRSTRVEGNPILTRTALAASHGIINGMTTRATRTAILEEPKEKTEALKNTSPVKTPDGENKADPAPEGKGTGNQQLHSYVNARSYEGWIDEAVEDYSRKGGFKDLPGAGKPLVIDDDDDLYKRTVKNSNYIPSWLEQRKQIAERMKGLIERGETGDALVVV
ncbi:uncharacterized protein PITG_21218 [Phytophthora infestans T30-4]|uniref:DnaJ homologue subfamily C member 28 conserved domain-containing protein n=1 Tax=Phytophthora infestans (strain T30-4) TaxID=403677 RepID=D0P3E3_PHYIT|nr:uncharacterized protein PITG_21218 [Phytophthora infestans T30-4]EEY59493.1 hypothetical protein PITG_21218 [Phytophthora infestans T30-4]|eukprot:XP_002895182.1 hypothetical protein PITG_21218 [Phytophthora infestans T30-4]